MFPDSKIVEKMQRGPNKLKYLINHGVRAYVQEILIVVVRDAE